MATEQINARDWIFQVSDGEATPTWIDIAGINSYSYKPGENQEDVDTTTFESQGTYESQAMQRGATLELTGRYLLDTTAGTRDPGQDRVDALAALVGNASLGDFRFRHTSDQNWTVWTAWASASEQSGGNNDKTSWGTTLTKSGPATTTAVTP